MHKPITTFNSWVPVRSEPKSAAEIVTSLLFGETATVLEETDEWIKVSLTYDGYEGWVGKEYILESGDNLDLEICTSKRIRYQGKFGSIPVPAGGELRGTSLSLGNETLKMVQDPDTAVQVKPQMIGPNAVYHFLHAPYLWGGRSIHGIDCSGLVQVCMKMAGQRFPRDASEQEKKGASVTFGEHALNDLAFFHKSNKVTHVGIVLNNNQIIHASGRVRIDTLTANGIYNSEMQKLTHPLHSIKRVAL